jgi:hypothetical protein
MPVEPDGARMAFNLSQDVSFSNERSR